MMDYLQANAEYWSQAVYDTPNPETYAFRLYGRVIKHQFGLDGSSHPNLLDFGCGAGGNCKFFADRGFNVHGVDQSKVDISRIKERIPNLSSNFKCISPICNADDIWFPGIKFKIIVSFQTLYYLSDTDLKKRLISLNNMLEPGGYFIATMMHISSWYFDMSTPSSDGLHFVKFHRDQDKNRPGLSINDHFINFTDSEADLIDKFSIFTPLHTKGYYDGIYRDDQGSEKHLIFVGQKKKS
ncbi:class I SAM-dependent methyltransferase [Synechococcus sp. MU1617]|nr:class I SAM-dependent methyltransferase [Synechococcus sp. MU1617]